MPGNAPPRLTLMRDRSSLDRRRVNATRGYDPAKYSDEYYTPGYIVEALGAFDLDPSAGPMTYAARNVRLPENGLAIAWERRVWLNPPYLDIEPWLQRFAAHGNGVCLVNNRVETHWYQRLVKAADSVLLLRGRIKFMRPDGHPAVSPPTGSTLVAYGRQNAVALQRSGLDGLFLAPLRGRMQ
jgi:hypothetical protein